MNHLAGEHPTNSESEQDLAAVVRLLTDRLHAGISVDLQEIIEDHPNHAEDIEELWPALQAIATASNIGTKDPEPASPALPDNLHTLGDFRIVREIGRGGMGVVYEALQISLGRQVALKILPFAGMLDERHLSRFHNEARAAATLHHNHVVPVYFVGSERGVHFYAMQLIDGQSVAELIDILKQENGQSTAQPTVASSGQMELVDEPSANRLRADQETQRAQKTDRVNHASSLVAEHSSRPSSYYRTVAKLGIEAAEALDHAHEHGVLHRDIKPGNLLVDQSGKLWVTDFGLARLEGEANVTMTGDIVGTYRYMAPEVALAKRVVVDHRADIYSLGATLYEMLTLQPAVSGRDREQLLKNVAFEEPMAPRKINRSIPTELETIVQRAMEKNPADRFASADDLAKELQRYLDEVPLKTKPPGMIGKLYKWSRRHPSFVAATVVTLLVTLASLATILGLMTHNRSRLIQVIESEQSQRHQAIANLRIAKEAVDEWYVQFGEEWIQHQPGLTEQQRDFLEKAVAFYDGYVSLEPSGITSRRDQIETLQRLAEVQVKLSKINEGQRINDRAIELGMRLINDAPDNLENHLALATSRHLAARIHNQRRGWEKSHELHQLALQGLDAVPLSLQNQTNWRLAFAEAQVKLGDIQIRRGQADVAEQMLEDARCSLEELLQLEPRSIQIQRQLQQCLDKMAISHLEFDTPITVTGAFIGPQSVAVTQYSESLALAYSIYDADPAKLQNKLLLAGCCGRAGKFLKPDEAFRHLSKAEKIRKELYKNYPEVPGFTGLGTIYHQMESSMARVGRYEEALVAAQKDIEHQLRSNDFNNGDSEKHLAGAYMIAARHLLELGRLEDAKQTLQSRIDVLTRAIQNPDLNSSGKPSWSPADFRQGLAEALDDLADVADRLANSEDAAEARTRSVKIRKRLISEKHEFKQLYR